MKRHGVVPTLGSRRLADAWLATARAHRRRVDGRDDPEAWVGVGDALGGARHPVREGSCALA